ncbi:MAG TPA: cell division protein FtsQ/DivIB [Pseudolabrys sp.]|nr:cell division protein FtsQ/DivIB [Pseudolabrys sp.]
MMVVAGRWRRWARRRLAPILQCDPPRGLGSAAAIVFVLGSVGYGVAKGGHMPEIAAGVQEVCDAAANAAGFRISSVAMNGETALGREQVLRLAGITDHSSLLFLNAAATRARLEADPWIAEATVLKLYPGQLQIRIKERKAFALWQNNGEVSVIAADGAVLQPFTPRFRALPFVVGDGAQRKAQAFLRVVGEYRDIADQIASSVLVADRRWNLNLKNGVEVRLPETGIQQALDTLLRLDRDKKLLSRDITVVDLRLHDRVSVRLSDAAAAARAEAFKPKKPKRKGSDA